MLFFFLTVVYSLPLMFGLGVLMCSKYHWSSTMTCLTTVSCTSTGKNDFFFFFFCLGCHILLSTNFHRHNYMCTLCHRYFFYFCCHSVLLSNLTLFQNRSFRSFWQKGCCHKLCEEWWHQNSSWYWAVLLNTNRWNANEWYDSIFSLSLTNQVIEISLKFVDLHI